MCNIRLQEISDSWKYPTPTPFFINFTTPIDVLAALNYYHAQFGIQCKVSNRVSIQGPAYPFLHSKCSERLAIILVKFLPTFVD